MKKIILSGMIVFAMNAMSAQTTTTTPDQTTPDQTMPGQTGQNNQINVPAQVRTQFNTDYPNTDVTWGRDGNNYTATYKDQSTQGGRMVTYDKNGKVLYSDSELNGSGYPTGIDDYYGKNHPNEKYTIWSSDDGNGDMSYYSKGKNGKTSWFDKSGKYSSKRPSSDSETQNAKTNKGNSKDKTNNTGNSNSTGKGTK